MLQRSEKSSFSGIFNVKLSQHAAMRRKTRTTIEQFLTGASSVPKIGSETW
jgi:hypothetical protein|tara:strand:- start:129 stop:281 length:153 start_codon:yes stop_codon:yes gene_type:complete